MFFVTPLLPAIVTLLPILMWPTIPTCPPITTLSPITTLPDIPTWAAIIAGFPIITLCAIWTRLSIKQFSEIIVESNTALSIVVLEPMLQLFLIITFPKCWILILVLGSNPKPVPPITAPDLIIQFSPIILSEITELDLTTVFLLIVTFGPIVQLDSIITFSSILQFSLILTKLSIWILLLNFEALLILVNSAIIPEERFFCLNKFAQV